MIISKKIHKARKIYACSNCNDKINIGEKYMRTFGAAFADDPKYEMMLCCGCEPIKNIKSEAANERQSGN